MTYKKTDRAWRGYAARTPFYRGLDEQSRDGITCGDHDPAGRSVLRDARKKMMPILAAGGAANLHFST